MHNFVTPGNHPWPPIVRMLQQEDQKGTKVRYAKRKTRERARVEARCAWCGFVALGVDDLRVRVGRDEQALVEFVCSSCSRLNLRRLAPGDLSPLADVGVVPSAGMAPFELLEAHDGPPLGWDDLLDLHEALDRHDMASVRTWNDGPAGVRTDERDAA
jgi:hypothetical protein